MRILAMVQGHYGKRIAENIKRRAPEGWTVDVITAPKVLPPIVDEPEEFLPAQVPQADILLALTESPGAAQLIPALIKLSGTKAVIAPVDNSAWLPAGLKNQLKEELHQVGVKSVFPKTFCTLTETHAGFGTSAEPYDDKYIALFARYFGRPKLKIKVDEPSGTICEVFVERGAPCGSTHFAAEKLVGIPVKDALPKAGLTAHHYPCLASMQQEQIDDNPFETLMHVSGYVLNEEVERHIKASEL